jgi:hypothetical protein
MKTVKSIKNRPVTIGGEEHSGWLPAGAATPLPTPIRHLLLNFEVQFDGAGYLLCYESTDGTVSGDTWHHTLDEAEKAANDWFNIADTEWRLQ